MLKLYKSDNGITHYWETWDSDAKTAIVHWGILGERGQDKEVKSSLLTTFRKLVQKEIDQKLEEGYEEIDGDEQYLLFIEYIIEGMGTDADLDKRHRLQEKMDSVLGWTGLGHCDGGSTGNDTMEVCCIVVDFDIARTVIEQALQDTEFADYARIYNEDE